MYLRLKFCLNIIAYLDQERQAALTLPGLLGGNFTNISRAAFALIFVNMPCMLIKTNCSFELD